MLVGLVATFWYIAHFKFVDKDPTHWFLGVSPEGIGFVFMFGAMAVGVVVALLTKAPPQDIQDLVEDIRIPNTRSAHGGADAGMAPTPAE